jgi:hypothetical protein
MLRKSVNLMRSQLGPTKQEKARLKDEMDIMVAEHRKLLEKLDKSMNKNADL